MLLRGNSFTFDLCMYLCLGISGCLGFIGWYVCFEFVVLHYLLLCACLFWFFDLLVVWFWGRQIKR